MSIMVYLVVVVPAVHHIKAWTVMGSFTIITNNADAENHK